MTIMTTFRTTCSATVRTAFISALTASVACSVSRAPNFPSDWRFRPGASAVRAPKAMVASNSEIASRVGADIMRRGGNAVDAAVAVGFALTVTYPGAGNIGGGGFMVIRLASGETMAIDYREVAPGGATRDMYVDSAGNVTDRSLIGHLASGVPGAVAGMSEALKRYGTMPLRDVIAPALALADSGFTIDSAFSDDLDGDSASIRQFEGGRLFFPGGRVLQPGTRLRQTELAWTFRQIAERGADGFYKGPVADSLVAEMRRGGGLITHEDLRAYKPIWRAPVRGTYRGHTILSMPPASSGGITMVEALNILETYERPAPFGSTLWAHRIAEAFQRAFIDRNAKIGDPAFVSVPQAQLTSKEYARELRRTIDDSRHTPTTSVAPVADGMHTTHYSVVDAAGNAVAVTTTLNGGYGSGVWVRGAGFFLNNEMDDFTSKPGSPNMFGLIQGEQNAIAPGKRMLSAMTPTIVLDPAGEVLLVLGGAGGPTIITGTANVILNVVDHRMSLADAMRAPRLHHQSLPDSLVWERNGLSKAVQDSLRAMGHSLRERRSLVNMNAIMRVRGGWVGVSEPRAQGGAAGY